MENEIKAGQTNAVDNTAAQDTGAVVNGQAGSPVPAKQENNQESVNEGGAVGSDNGAPQDDATNAKFAEMRRSYERRLKDAEAEAAKAREDALKAQKIEMVKALHKSNPWTGETIEDEFDVEELLAMQALADAGEDPMTAYPKHLKQQKKTAAQAAKEKADSEAQKQSRAQAGLQEFSEKYPGVNVQELFADEDFLKFGKDALEFIPLTKVYEAYLPIKTERDRIAAEQQKAAAMAANSSVAVGSVTSATPAADSEFFTKEQVLKMSKEEISKNYEKIRKSQEKW